MVVESGTIFANRHSATQCKILAVSWMFTHIHRVSKSSQIYNAFIDASRYFPRHLSSKPQKFGSQINFILEVVMSGLAFSFRLGNQTIGLHCLSQGVRLFLPLAVLLFPR